MDWITQITHALVAFMNIILHLDVHLAEWIRTMGPWLYGVVFLIVFAETGLVVTPFLPGDSLLFALGAFTAGDNPPLSLVFLLLFLISAGVLGDAVNYAVGRHFGPRIFRSETSKLFNKHHLVRTEEFYEKYGAKTIIIARFLPIIRTFAPFVAGIGQMKYVRFATYNIIGAVAWVTSFLLAGHFFGNLPAVKRNFHLVIIAIIVISAIPPVLEWWRARRNAPAT